MRHSSARRNRARGTRLIGLITLLLFGALASSYWWAPQVMARLAYFRVRRIEIDGARYSTSNDVLRRLRVDTTWSVWTNLERLARRVEADPLIADATVERKLPGTLHVTLRERVPVAMVPIVTGLVVLDADGHSLPIDPSRVGGIDVPVLAARDSAALRVLGMLQRYAPTVFARVSEVRRVDAEELRFAISTAGGSAAAQSGFILRAGPDLTAARLADLFPVESDLARRRVRVAEIDLRYRDQVIARLQ